MNSIFLLADIAGFFKQNNMFIFLGVAFIAIYFVMIRPQRKKEAEVQLWLKNLKRGDEVITHSGIWGKVAGSDEKGPYVTLELQEKVRVRVLRSALAGKAPSIDGSSGSAGEEKKG